MQSYNVVNYDEKVMDGFYDLYGITANSSTRGKMPLLVDLKEICVTGDIDYEVILVNRLLDPELQQLERQAYNIFMDCGVSEHGFILSGLVQKLADVVVARMGGPVGDAEEMLRRWTLRSYELRSSLNTIILPLGRLDIGLARHRALLFKVANFHFIPLTIYFLELVRYVLGIMVSLAFQNFDTTPFLEERSEML